MSRVILHSDCNSFYASVECALDPKLKGKAVAVSGNAENRHGIILAKSQKAKEFGVKTGEPVWQAKQKCPHIIILPPNFPKYMEYSKRTKEIYNEYTDMVESFGLDEAWLDVTGSRLLFGDGLTIAKEISERIKKELDITVSIGVSYNKIFAKLGSDYKKPDGITVISKENYKNIVWSLPAEDLLYVGPATKRKLYNMGIRTIGQIANTPMNVLRSNLGKWGDMLYCFANGFDNSPVARWGEQSAVKSIGNSTTTPRDMENNEDVKVVLYILADSVARRMREQGLWGKTVTVTIRDNQLFSFSRQKQMNRRSNVTSEILNTSMEIFKANYNWNKNVRSIGISVSDFTAAKNGMQMCLFEDEKKIMRLEKLDAAMDSLKNRFGRGIVNSAVTLKNKGLSSFNPKDDHTVHPLGYF